MFLLFNRLRGEIIVFVKGAIHKTNALKRKGIVKSHSLTDWVYGNVFYFS